MFMQKSEAYIVDALRTPIGKRRGSLAQTHPADLGGFQVTEKSLTWNPKETAIVICDMWDKHWCAGAT